MTMCIPQRESEELGNCQRQAWCPGVFFHISDCQLETIHLSAARQQKQAELLLLPAAGPSQSHVVALEGKC